MRNSYILAFVVVMFVSAMFIANHNKDEIGNYPAARATVQELPLAAAKGAAATLVKLPAVALGLTAASAPWTAPSRVPFPTAAPGPGPTPAPALRTTPPPALPAEPGEAGTMMATVASYAPSGPAAASEGIRGPVCVQVDNPGARNVVTGPMTGSEAESYRRYYDYAELFLRNTCARFILAPPPLLFVTADGHTKIAPVAPYGFVLFDGFKQPLVVEPVDQVKQIYSSYFGIEIGAQ